MAEENNKDEEVVNKLILVGNGLDLALGLKTSYTEFLLWYLKDSIISGWDGPFKRLSRGFKRPQYIGWNVETELMRFQIKAPNNREDAIKDFGYLTSLKDFLNLCNDKKIGFEYIFEDGLLNSIINSSNLDKWVDIELLYFQKLKDIVCKENSLVQKVESAKLLNEELILISKELQKYLDLNIQYDTINREQLRSIRQQFLESNGQIESDGNSGEGVLSDLYVLNFNYTKSLTLNFKNLNVNHIHGEVSDEELIFGYGDEMDRNYKEFEELNENEFLRCIKSFGYFMSPKYRELLGFINSGKFQVCVYGHSCGLSDRVMLNEIFEHKNCHSIRVYFRDEAEFVNKTMEISRHFTSNKLMRQKLIDFQREDRIPQWNDFTK